MSITVKFKGQCPDPKLQRGGVLRFVYYSTDYLPSPPAGLNFLRCAPSHSLIQAYLGLWYFLNVLYNLSNKVRMLRNGGGQGNNKSRKISTKPSSDPHTSSPFFTPLAPYRFLSVRRHLLPSPPNASEHPALCGSAVHSAMLGARAQADADAREGRPQKGGGCCGVSHRWTLPYR